MKDKVVEEAIRAVMAARLHAKVSLGIEHPVTVAFRESEELLLAAVQEPTGIDLSSREGRELVVGLQQAVERMNLGGRAVVAVPVILDELQSMGFEIVKKET